MSQARVSQLALYRCTWTCPARRRGGSHSTHCHKPTQTPAAGIPAGIPAGTREFWKFPQTCKGNRHGKLRGSSAGTREPWKFPQESRGNVRGNVRGNAAGMRECWKFPRESRGNPAGVPEKDKKNKFEEKWKNRKNLKEKFSVNGVNILAKVVIYFLSYDPDFFVFFNKYCLIGF